MRTALAVALLLLEACTTSQGSWALPQGFSTVRDETVTISDFKRIVAWGSKGKSAIAQCPQHYKVVAGGSSSSDGSFVGTGYADTNVNGWVVKPDSSASAEAFATCVLRGRIGNQFHWRSSAPVSGIAGAQCRGGYILITGYGRGTVSASWFDPRTNTYWVTGGGTAYASCARKRLGIAVKHAWNKSQKPKAVYAGCGDGYTVIGGAMGDDAWPGPPVQQHPGIGSDPGQHGYKGWWTFSNALNELTWAACVQT
jgi:hypothetical protein